MLRFQGKSESLPSLASQFANLGDSFGKQSLQLRL